MRITVETDGTISPRRALETSIEIMVNQLKAEFFWRDPYKNEVDAVLWEDKPVPVEITYGKVSTEGVERFMRKFKVAEGYVLSRDTEEEIRRDGNIIHVIPAFKYLLQGKRLS